MSAAKKKAVHNPFDSKREFLLKDVKSYSQLFEGVTPWLSDPGKVHEIPSFNLGDHESRGYVQIHVVASDKHFAAIRITPTQKLVDCVQEHMLFIEHDSKFFEIIVFPDNTSHLICKYNQIIGSRHVAKFDAKETRRFFRELKEKHGVNHPSLPSAQSLNQR